MPGNSGKLCRGACSGMMLQNNKFGQTQQCNACNSRRPRSSHNAMNDGRNATSATADHGRFIPKMMIGCSRISAQPGSAG